MPGKTVVLLPAATFENPWGVLVLFGILGVVSAVVIICQPLAT